MKKRKQKAYIVCIIIIIYTVLLGGCSRQTPGTDSKNTSGSETVQESLKEAESEKTGSKDGKGSQEGQRNPKDSGESAENEAQRDIQVPKMTREEYPKVDGSTATLPLSTALYQLVTGADEEEAHTAVVHTKTTNAYMSLLDGRADLVIAYEPAQSVYDAMEESGQKMNIKPIGKDALVFMANEGNPVDSLKGSELVEIYSGRYKNWSQVGGEKKELVAFQRPVNSGSQTLMEKLVMKGIPMAEAPQSRVVGDMGELIEKVAFYNNEENALGYSVYFYARNMYQKPGLKFMAVDGVMPDNETIKNGTYPYVNEFYAAVRMDEPVDSPAYRLFQWLSEEDGQGLIESLGYVGMEEAPNIHVTVENLQEEEKGNVKLEKDARILMSGDYVTGEDSVVVIGPDMEIEQTITGMRIEKNIVNIRGEEAVLMTDISTERMGLYSVGAGKWMVEPVYEYLWEESEDIYSGYRDGQPCKVVWNEKEKAYTERMGDFVQVGDFWWRWMEKSCDIFDSGDWLDETAEPVKVIDFPEKNPYSFGYESKGLYIMSYGGSGEEVYDGAGNRIFGEEIPGTMYTVYDINPERHWIWAAEDGSQRKEDESFIYDYEKKQVITSPGDLVDYMDGESKAGYFTVTRGTDSFVCGEDGKPVVSADGGGFDRSFGDGWCGRQKDGVMTIEKPDTGERFEIPWKEGTDGYRIMGNLFWIRDPETNKEAFYLGEQCLAKEMYLLYNEHEEACVLYGDGKSFVVNTQGEIVYEGSRDEWIMEIFPEYLVIDRGNYLYITDYEGKCAFRHLGGYMGDD